MNYFYRLQSTYNKTTLPHNITFDYYLHMGKNQKPKKKEKKELNIMGYKFIIHLSYTFLGQVISIRLIFFSPYSYINHKI